MDFIKLRYPRDQNSATKTELDYMEYANDGAAQAVFATTDANKLQVHSELTIVKQGTYSMKILADATDDGTEEVKTNNLSISLSGKDVIVLWTYSTAANSDWTIDIEDSVGGHIVADRVLKTEAEEINTWIQHLIDISAVADANKSDIDVIKFDHIAAGAATMYVDNCFGITEQTVTIDSNAPSLPLKITPVTNIISIEAVSGYRQTVKLGIPRDSIELNFSHLDYTDYDLLKDFVEQLIDFGLNPFQIEDVKSSEIWDVYLDSYATQRKKNNKYGVAMKMIELIEAT